MAIMATPPFKVRALYEYNSPHDDDLSFPETQIITVTEEEDDDWYIGEYTDANGGAHSGLFPKIFVEKYEPAPPPRPTRSRPKPAEPLAEFAPPPPPTEPEPESGPSEASVARELQPPVDPERRQSPRPAEGKPVETASAAKKVPPPVAAKSNSFKDRIAAFNKPAAAPVAPFKPSSGGTGFIKKPFVAPPPARDAYVPPPREKQPPPNIYRREEDPEIAEQRAQDEENARQAGLSGSSHAAPTATDENEDAPKPIALKDRIAMLQKQQREQAEKQANVGQSKEKSKRPPKKRTESYGSPEADGAAIEKQGSREQTDRPSIDALREMPPAPVRKHSHTSRPEAEPFSDGGNDADQSAAGETTEDAGGSSTSVDDEEEKSKRHPAAQAHEADVGDEEEDDEEDEGQGNEEEVDEEQARQDRLRERMRMLAGAGRGGGMFNPMNPLGFNPMMGGGAPASIKKSSKPKSEPKPAEDDEQSYAQSAPPPGMRMALPGMGTSKSPEPIPADDYEEDEPQNSGARAAEGSQAAAPPIKRNSTGGRSIPSVPQAGATGAPPVPGRRSSLESRPAPPQPPAMTTMSGPEDSESDDEMPRREDSQGLPSSRPIPPARPAEPQPPQSPPSRPQPPPVPTSPRYSTTERGAPPPVPVMSSPASQARGPPPPPPGAPPPRQHTSDSIGRQAAPANDKDRESEYEGDYDTDIASSAKHKDALTAHMREDSRDDSTTADEASTRAPLILRAIPPVPAPAAAPNTRAMPPPPQEPVTRRSVDMSKRSMDSPRAPPPMPPPRPAIEVEDYDPYNYPGIQYSAAPRMPPPPPAPPGGPPQPTHTAPVKDDNDEEKLYQPLTKSSTDRKGPLSGGIPTVPQERGPPPTSAQTSALPALPSRRSIDAETAMRRSIDVLRPSHDAASSGFIACDVDLGQASRWWSQPDTPPPAFQNRRDILLEIEESTTSKRGGQATMSKDVFVIFQDYSKTIINAQFDVKNVDDVQLSQRHEAPPGRLRQDQLEDAHSRFGARLASMVSSKEGSAVGDGSSQALVLELLSQLPGALLPVGTRAYGALVYQNIGNATVAQYDEIRPGDIVSFRNARFHGKHGSLHTKYSQEVGKPDHVGVVAEWDGTKKKVKAWEQGKDDGEDEKGKKKNGKVKVKGENFRLGDLRSGEVRIWRIMGRGWIGWEQEA